MKRAMALNCMVGKPLTMDEPSVFSSVLEGSMAVSVSQRQVLRYGCSSTVQALFPLSADCMFGKCRGPRAGDLHAARTGSDGHNDTGTGEFV